MALKIVTPKAPPMPDFPPAIAPEVKLVHEQFPRVGAKIATMWGSVELQRYLGETIFDARGDRQGFPQPVIMALMNIYRFHETLIPDAGNECVWDKIV
jgi:hypothetical protein